MSDAKTIRAGLVIIGNEILSGRTLDKNTQYIANKLGEHGITLAEVRIIPDIQDKIVTTIHALQDEMDYVLTTGGLGPTHDDITVDCIAAAFGVPVEVNPEAFERLLKHYGSEEEFTPARQRMARIPQGAALIDNPVSTAPGFHIGKVFAMAGVPRIMQAMLDNVLTMVEGGDIKQSRTVGCALPESQIAAALGMLQDEYPDIDIGSYPFFHAGNVGVSVVLRATHAALLDEATAKLITALETLDGHPKQID